MWHDGWRSFCLRCKPCANRHFLPACCMTHLRRTRRCCHGASPEWFGYFHSVAEALLRVWFEAVFLKTKMSIFVASAHVAVHYGAPHSPSSASELRFPVWTVFFFSLWDDCKKYLAANLLALPFLFFFFQVHCRTVLRYLISKSASCSIVHFLIRKFTQSCRIAFFFSSSLECVAHMHLCRKKLNKLRC